MREQWQMLSESMVSRMRMRGPSMYGCLSTRQHAGKQACLIGKVHVPRTVRPYKQRRVECGSIRHGTATEGLSHALQPAHGTILAYLDSYPSETSPPNRCWRCCRRIHTAEICTLFRLRLLLAERVEAHALCILLQAPACISPSSLVFPYPPASRLQKRRDQTTKWNFANRPARHFLTCRPLLPAELCKPPSLHNSPTNHRLLHSHAQTRDTPFQPRRPVLCKSRMTHIVHE
jgi:hypothetical protein